MRLSFLCGFALLCSGEAAAPKTIHEALERIPETGGDFSIFDSLVEAGADLNIVRDQKGAIIDLQQDGSRYFDLHHTPDDTLDKIDKSQLRQNVAVWTTVVGILANEPRPILTGGIKPSAPATMEQ